MNTSCFYICFSIFILIYATKVAVQLSIFHRNKQTYLEFGILKGYEIFFIQVLLMYNIV